MRGYPTKTPERVAEAQRMRKDGVSLKEIGEHFGISLNTAHAWITDPDGAKKRARVDSYRVPCVECGALASGHNGYRAVGEVAYCDPCSRAARMIWTRDAIALAIQEWADTHGGIPPTTSEWLVKGPDRTWPYPASVLERFGSWNAAIAAAGLEPRPVGCYGRPGEDPAEVARTVELYRSGMTSAEVGAVLGCSGSAVRDRLRKVGEPRRPRGGPRREAA